MRSRLGSRGFWGGLLVAFLGSAVALWATALNAPDREIVFVREAPTSLDEAGFDLAVRVLANWPSWHHMTHDVKAIDARGLEYARRDQVVLTGSVLKLVVRPKGLKRRQYELWMQVTEYAPKRAVRLRLVHDSKGRVSRIFSRLEWTIEYVPKRRAVRGTVRGQTSHWRSRLFGMIAERILMNQVFLADVQKLAELKQPLSLDSVPQFRQ